MGNDDRSLMRTLVSSCAPRGAPRWQLTRTRSATASSIRRKERCCSIARLASNTRCPRHRTLSTDIRKSICRAYDAENNLWLGGDPLQRIIANGCDEAPHTARKIYRVPGTTSGSRFNLVSVKPLLLRQKTPDLRTCRARASRRGSESKLGLPRDSRHESAPARSPVPRCCSIPGCSPGC